MLPVFSVRDVPGPYLSTITTPPPAFLYDSKGVRVNVNTLVYN
jgi:hypothetical protein